MVDSRCSPAGPMSTGRGQGFGPTTPPAYESEAPEALEGVSVLNGLRQNHTFPLSSFSRPNCAQHLEVYAHRPVRASGTVQSASPSTIFVSCSNTETCAVERTSVVLCLPTCCNELGDCEIHSQITTSCRFDGQSPDAVAPVPARLVKR